MRRFRAGSGAPWEARVGYSRVVRVGAHVHVTGTTATQPDGGPFEGDAYEQTQQVVRNLERALARVGARLDEVVRTRMFVTDITSDWEAIGRAHAEAFGELRPATSMVEVAALIAPWMRVEIEADAILGASAPIDAPEVYVGDERPGDRPSLIALAQSEALLVPGPEVSFVIATDLEGALVAAAGLERHGDDAILRSIVTRPSARGAGVGTLLVDTLRCRHRDLGFWLATRDRAPFFARFGFRPIDRDRVPEALAATETFVHAACADATLMHLPRGV